MVSEFIDAYSDDQIYLETLERLVNNHSVEVTVPNNIKYSSFSRLWAVMMLGSIECMIKEWGQEHSAKDIYAYFEKGSNAELIKKLITAFEIRGIRVDVDHFEDYLAVKYIRNAYIHSEWFGETKHFVKARCFPDNLMSFNEMHLEKMKASYFHVMQYLRMAKAFHTIVTNYINQDF